MNSNIFLYSTRYAKVRGLWDTSKNGDIDLIQPKKHDKVEYWWRCPSCGKSYKARPLSIANMIDKGKTWCKECYEGFNPAKEGESFEDYYPELSKLWDNEKNGVLKPSMLRVASNKEVWWKCPDCGNSYLRTPHTQAENKTDGYCVNCYPRHVKREFKYGSLGDLYPDIALNWSDKNKISPYEISPSSNIKYLWKCKDCGEEWVASVFSMTNKGRKCPVCNGVKYKKGYTDFKTRYPDIIKVWDYSKNTVNPEDIFFKDEKSYWFICPRCGKSFEKRLASFKKTGGLCASCAIYNSKLSKLGSLLDARPDLASQFDEERNGIKVGTLLAHDTRQLWWKCDKGHTFQRSCHERVKSKGVCPVCDGKEVIKGYNDFESNYPEIAKYWCYDLNDCLPSEVAKNSGRIVWWVCPICGDVYQSRVDDRTRSTGCPNCGSRGYASQEEKELLAEIRSWGIYAEENAHIFEGSRKSVDIFVPYKNIAIEFNGLFWHSEEAVGRSYHYEKYKMCKDIGVELIYVWEDDFVKKRSVVLNMLKRKLGVSSERKIGARNCKLRLITYAESKDFLDKNHIQGSVSGTYYVGIFHEKELVGVGVFGTENCLDYTLKRYATNCILQGGFSKMISYFKNNTWCRSIETFSDNGVSDGKLYIDNGFKVVDLVKPDYQYIVSSRRTHKFNFRKDRFKRDENLLYEEGKTESELADMNGLKRIWDAGKVKYVKDWSVNL